MIGNSRQRIKDGQLHISPDMSNRKESKDKKSFDLERTHNGQFRFLSKHTLYSKYSGFDLNVCERILKDKKVYVRRNVNEVTRRFQ